MRTDGSLLALYAPRDFAGETRARLDQLTEELATGRQYDTGRALRSDFSSFSRVTHDLRTFDARQEALKQATIWTDVAQASLGAIDSIGTGLAEGLVTGLTSTDGATLSRIGRIGEAALADMGTVLARTEGGRSVFANGDTSGNSPYDILLLQAETKALAQGATDTASLLQALDAYFASGGDVENGALGTFPPAPTKFPLGGGEAIQVPLDGGDPALRDSLKQAALASVLPHLGFPLSQADLQTLAAEMPRRSVAAGAGLANLRGSLGSVEARIDLLSERLSSERIGLEKRRTDAVGTDPFDVANRLQGEMSRLETIYAVTARRSRLNLTDYLR